MGDVSVNQSKKQKLIENQVLAVESKPETSINLLGRPLLEVTVA